MSSPLFNEPMRVETVRSNGSDSWIAGLVGTHSERFRNVTFSASDLASLTIHDATPTCAGNANLLRVGLQAYCLGIAYEFDPYFGLSISRVDPLWIATHSIGMIKKAMDIERGQNGSVVFLDFCHRDYDQPVVIQPVRISSNLCTTCHVTSLDESRYVQGITPGIVAVPRYGTISRGRN